MNTKEIENIAQTANQYIEQDSFEDCYNYLNDKKAQFGNNIELLKILGLCCINLKKNDEAIELFEKVTSIDAQDATSWYYLGSVYDIKGMLPEAQEAYEKVIELRDEYLDAYKNLAIVLIKNSDFDYAQKIALHALELSDKQDYQIYYILSTIALRKGDFQDVINYIETALQYNPNHIQMLNNIGSAYLALFDFQNAQKYYQRAYELKPDVSITNFNLGMMYHLMQKTEESYSYLKRSYELDSGIANLTALANAAMNVKKWEEAAEYYKKLVKLQPTNLEHHKNLALALAEGGDYENAIKALDVVYAADVNNMEVVQKLIDLYMLSGEFTKLKMVLAQVIKRGKISVSIYYTYAIALVKTGDIDGAINIFKKVCMLAPQDPIPHKDLGVIYLAQKLFDYARIEFKTAYDLAPDNPMIIFEYATFLYQIHEYSEAEQYYQKVEKLIPDDINVNLYSGLNYLQLNKPDEALERLIKVYKEKPDNSVAAFSIARIYYQQKKFDAAKQILIGLTSFNNDLEIYNLFALINVELKEYDDAVMIYKKILELSPNTPNILMQLAKCEIELGHKDEALKYLNEYLEVIPDSEEANELIWKIS